MKLCRKRSRASWNSWRKHASIYTHQWCSNSPDLFSTHDVAYVIVCVGMCLKTCCCHTLLSDIHSLHLSNNMPHMITRWHRLKFPNTGNTGDYVIASFQHKPLFLLLPPPPEHFCLCCEVIRKLIDKPTTQHVCRPIVVWNVHQTNDHICEPELSIKNQQVYICTGAI